MINIKSINIQDIPDEEYFKIDAVSNSKLGLLDPSMDGSVEKYKKGFPKADKSFFNLGSIVHECTLQKDLYELSDVLKPSSKCGLWADAVYKYRKNGYTLIDAFKKASDEVEYYVNKLKGKVLKTSIQKSLAYYIELNKKHTGQKILRYSDKKFARKLIEQINNHKDVSFDKGYNEVAIIATLDIDGKEIVFKGKVDHFEIKDDVIYLDDLKTSSHYNFIEDAYKKYHYYRQLAIYGLFLSMYYGIKKVKSRIIVAKTISPYKMEIYNGTKIKEGLDEFYNLMYEVARIV